MMVVVSALRGLRVVDVAVVFFAVDGSRLEVGAAEIVAELLDDRVQLAGWEVIGGNHDQQ